MILYTIKALLFLTKMDESVMFAAPNFVQVVVQFSKNSAFVCVSLLFSAYYLL